VRLDDLVREIVDGMESIASTKDVSLSIGSLPAITVAGDELWLRQLLNNIVDNAIKFSAHGKDARRVQVSLGTEGTDAVVTVTDSGPGIPEDELPRLFDRFYRGDESRTRGEGVGLGLAICAWVARSHGGSIALLNVAGAGSGAECSIKLPLAASGDA